MMKSSLSIQFRRQRAKRSRYPKRFLTVVFLFVCLCAGFAGPLLAGELSSFQLRAHVQADSTGVFLNQLVESSEPLPALRLSDSPAWGKISVFTRDQLATLLRDAGSDLTVSNWIGGETVRVSRRARAFTEADMLGLLGEALQRDYVKDRGELELRATRLWTELNLPDEPLTLKILEVPTAGVTPAFIARFQISTARESLGIYQSSFKANVWREVWVAHAAIKRGESLGNADVVRERRDVLPIRETLADFLTPVSTLEFAEPVISGNVLLARALKPRNVVRRGQIAQALLEDGTLSITMKVEILEDGAPGQIIRARNPLSRRDVRGKVINEQTILITL